jgi:uncharacterized protein (UPF0332 family)
VTAPAVASQLDEARRRLRSSRTLLDDGDPKGAANRLYYALYHGAAAALLHRGDVLPKTHAGLIASFGAAYVKTEMLSASLGRLINQAEQLRLTADYLGDEVQIETISPLLKRAAAFIAAIEDLTKP